LLSCLSYPVLTYISKLVPIWFSEQGISGSWFAGYYIAFGTGSFLVGVFIKRLMSVFRYKTTMCYSLFVVSLMLFGMSFTQLPWVLIVFTFGFGFFNALNRIARTNWMHHRVNLNERGRADGLLGMFATMVQNLSYLLIVFLSKNDLTHWGFWVAAVCVLLAAIIMAMLIRRQKNVKSNAITASVQFS